MIPGRFSTGTTMNRSSTLRAAGLIAAAALWASPAPPARGLPAEQARAGAAPATGSVAAAAPPAAPSALSAEEAREIAVETYVYAYPLVISELTRRVDLAAREGGGAMNQFEHKAAFPDASFTRVVRPNADTLYSMLWFDVSKEPLAVHVPDSGGRYYLLPMLDMWTEVFASPGARTTGTGAQLIVLASADWRGKAPAGATVIRSPTAMGWIIGRTQTNGVADYANVHRFQAGLKATSLKRRGKSYTPPRISVDPAWDLRTPPVEQIEKMGAAEFFGLFAQLTKLNPPHASDYPMVNRMARLGIVPGQPFSLAQSAAEVRQAIESARDTALVAIKGAATKLGVRRNGWRMRLSAIGTYGTDYLARAATAYGGLGANTVEDAVYPTAVADANGQPFSSDFSYVLRFTKEQLPPVRAFWSLTMYDERQLFAENPIRRYAIGDRDSLKYNADGSLDLYIQRESPGPGRESNWLPAPAKGPFTMNLRLYWPKPEVLDGTWSPPPVKWAN